jgi:hypothetical protein
MPALLSAQAPTRVVPSAATALPKLAERGIRGDIPMTNVIRRAFAAGTRDSTGRPGRNYWQLWNEYSIDAKIDPATSILTGHERIVIHNTSPDSLMAIQMRLDQNIFRPEVPRGSWTPAEITDGFVISKLLVDGQAADLSAPAGGRGGRGAGGRGAGGAAPPATAPTAFGFNRTSGSIRLLKPIPSHGTGTLEIDWTFKMAGGAGGGHRSTLRWGDSVYQATQWYPRVAVYDDLRGWDTEPYLGPSEFYNNFGRFDVRIDMPAGWLVGATGVLQNPQDVLTPTARERLSHVLESDSTRNIVSASEFGPGKATAAGDRLVWQFVADTVNDFAWVTSRSFIWDATRATVPGKGPIPINMLYTPGRAAAFAGEGQSLRHAIEFYSKIWLPLAFPVHTAADGPDDGMEYPMIVMSSNGAADHETGHEWWPMMVSSNETWYGWMDEGFNQYMNILSGADARHQVPSLNNYGQSYGRTSGSEAEGTLMWNANYGGPGYGFQAYSKTPLMLSMLGGMVGDSAVWHAQSEFAKAWRFKHPSPWDYMFMIERDLHQDLSWFWNAWVFNTDAVEGSITSVTTTGPKITVMVHQAGQMPSPVVLKVQFAPTGPAIRPMSNSRMIDSATAIVTWPVDVWFGGKRDFTAPLTFGARKIEKITLDPMCRFPNRLTKDNIWPRDTTSAAPPIPAGRGGGGGRGGACG